MGRLAVAVASLALLASVSSASAAPQDVPIALVLLSNGEPRFGVPITVDGVMLADHTRASALTRRL